MSSSARRLSLSSEGDARARPAHLSLFKFRLYLILRYSTLDLCPVFVYTAYILRPLPFEER